MTAAFFYGYVDDDGDNDDNANDANPLVVVCAFLLLVGFFPLFLFAGLSVLLSCG